MRLLLIGYGKMNRAVEELAQAAGHSIAAVVHAQSTQTNWASCGADIAVEFTVPDKAFSHVERCIQQGIPVLSGTTGWQPDALQELCVRQKGTFFYAPNFSLGMHVMGKLVRMLGMYMQRQQDYSVRLTETHHAHKKDAPSGSALYILRALALGDPAHAKWNLVDAVTPVSTSTGTVQVYAERIGEVVGTHTLGYYTAEEELSITHKVHTRQAFAQRVLRVLTWMHVQKPQGFLGMEDFLQSIIHQDDTHA